MQGLTSIERDVLQGIANGETPNEVAVRRQRTIATIKTQLSDIRDKLGALNTANAITIAFRRGLIH